MSASSPTKTAAPDFESKIDRITKPGQIAKHLQKLKDNNCLINVVIPGSGSSYNSSILRVYPSRNLLILDELNSKSGHEAIIGGKTFNAKCRLNGIEYRFTSSVQRVDRQGKIAMYHAAMPKIIQYLQRRGHYRVPVARDSKIEISVPMKITFEKTDEETGEVEKKLKTETIAGELADLSLGGIGIRLKTKTVPKRGQVLTKCKLVVPGSESILTEMEVAFALADNVHHIVRIGGRFVKLESKQKKKLIALVKKLEREYLRRQQAR